MNRLAPIFTALLLFGGPVDAAPERYAIDPAHTDLVWFCSHMGFSDSTGTFEGVHGTLMLDAHFPEHSSLDVTVPIDGLNTGQQDFTEHLLSKDFFWAEKYPTARFVSTRVEMTGVRTARVHGDLTLHGVRRPIALDVRLNKVGESPMAKKHVAGFSAETLIRRADFGIGGYSGMVGDEVRLVIEAEALKEGKMDKVRP